MTNNKIFKNVVLISNIIFAILLAIGLIIFIYFLSQLNKIGINKDVSHRAKDVAKFIGVFGMVFSFFPLGGLVLKLFLIVCKKYSKTSNNIFINSFTFILQWERKTRLLCAWSAIIFLVVHMMLLIAIINAVNDESLNLVQIHSRYKHGHKLNHYQWNYHVICGFVAIGLMVIMNLNGIAILLIKKLNWNMALIKWFSWTNLIFGISFLILVIIHII